MTNDNHARRVAEAQVIGASLALMKKTGWTIYKTATTALPTDFWNYLYVPCPELLLVPTIEDPRLLRSTVTEAVRAARSDALVVSLGKTARDELQASVRICMWSRIAAHWYGPHLPWLSLDGQLWLVPDHRAPVDEEPAFRRRWPAGAAGCAVYFDARSLSWPRGRARARQRSAAGLS